MLLLDDVPQTVAEQRLPLHHGVGPELLLVTDLVLLRGLGEAPQPADHFLLVFHVHRNAKLELGQLFTISSDNILPGESVCLRENRLDLLQISNSESFSQHLLDSNFKLLKSYGLFSVVQHRSYLLGASENLLEELVAIGQGQCSISLQCQVMEPNISWCFFILQLCIFLGFVLLDLLSCDLGFSFLDLD